MSDNPIVEKVRKVRNAHAKKFNYDLEAIAADLKAQQTASQRQIVAFAPRQPQPATIRQPTELILADEAGKYKP